MTTRISFTQKQQDFFRGVLLNEFDAWEQQHLIDMENPFINYDKRADLIDEVEERVDNLESLENITKMYKKFKMNTDKQVRIIIKLKQNIQAIKNRHTHIGFLMRE